MSVKYHDVNKMSKGRNHVSIRIDFPELDTEVFLDIECPEALSKVLPKALISLIQKEAKKHA